MLEAVDDLEIGCSAWVRRDPEANYEPRGGTIVAIENVLDEPTGEIKRRFAVLKRDGRRLRKEWIAAEEIDVESLLPPNPVTVRDRWRLLSRLVSEAKGSPLPEEGDYLRMAVQLYEAVQVR